MPIFRGGPKRPDVLVGTNRKDTMKGKGEDDLLIGRGGSDRLFGDEGDDWLFADRGKDRLEGGEGADRFSILDGRQRDVIRDFDRTEDVLDLSALGVRRAEQMTFERLDDDAVLITFRQHQVKVEGDFTIKQLQRSIDYADRLKLTFEALELERPLRIDGARLDGGRRFDGFTWEGFGVVDAPRANRADDSGHAATSGRTAAFLKSNVFAGRIMDDEPFDFQSVQVSAAWRDGLTVRVVGLLRGRFIGSEEFELGDAGEVQRLRLDDDIFNAVDEVRLSTSGGRVNPDTGLDGPGISIDDLIFFV
ncbi:MAG: hypothetical protein AAGI51_12490 [Pseudomonadota bacterium]